MKHPIDDIVGFFSGLFGGSVAAWVMGITWQNAWESAGKLLWLGFVAMFTGGMGVLGKHLIQRYLKRKK